LLHEVHGTFRVLTPRDCKDAYAYWEIPNERKEELRARGGEKLVIRLYDVTDNPASTAYQTIEVTSNNPDLHIPIARDNRDYKAEIGYLTNDNNWLPIAESAPVRVPACVPPVVSNPVQTAGYVSASGVAAAAAVAATTIKKKEEPSRIVLVPRSSESAYAYWEVPESLKASLRNEGGKHLTLKIHDSTDLNLDHQTPHATQEYDVSEVDQDKHVPILRSDRDYIAELGYKTDNGRWLSLARSLHVRVPSTLVTPPLDQIDTTTTASKRKRNVAEKASGVVEGLKDKGEDLLGSAGKLTGNLGEKAGGVVEGLKDKGEDLLGSAGKLTGNLGEKAGGFLGGLKDKGEDLLGSTGDLKENIGDKAGNILGNVFKAGGAAIAGGAAVVGGLGANVEKWAKDKTGSLLSHDRIELIPQDGNQARVNWQISEEEKTALKSHGGEKLILRICRTEGDIVWQSEIKESDHHQTVSVPETGLDYSADIGYLTASGQWLSLAKSAKVNVPKV
jgi:phosphate transport system substrate-binding protein